MKNRSICILATLIAFCTIYIQFSNEVIEYNNYFTIDNVVKYVDSDVIDEALVDEDIKIEEATTEEIVEEVVQPVVSETIDSALPKAEEVIEVIQPQNEVVTGKMSGYGPDCIGCSGYLANGHYVGNGNIYYNDSEYGQVRIVAGDKKYKFGTIIRINDSMLAIVLDRGGSIGIGKKFMFDLLYASEAEANSNGVSYNTKFEILRNGF
jgi:3D (Asp-Asp-Asp) domain-containing protein